jgi:DNA-binding PadR family transcriptional regulator
MDMFIDKAWIAKQNPEDKNFFITAKGEKELIKFRIDISQIKSEKGSITVINKRK